MGHNKISLFYIRKINQFYLNVGKWDILAISFFLFLAGVLQPTLYSKTLPQKEIIKINFQEGLKKLVRRNAGLLYNKANILTFEAYQDQADHAFVPEINILSFIAPNFGSTGNPLHSVRDYTVWGPTLSFQAQIVWPFYSFGKIALAKKAAKQGVAASRHLYKSKVNQTIFEYKKLYLSLIALKQLKSVLEEAKKQSSEILSEAQKQYATGEGNILKKDISRLKIYALEIQKLEEEHFANQKSARLALAHLLGEKNLYETEDDEFPDIETGALLLKNLIDLSFKEKPSLKGLRLGVLARKDLLKIEKKGLLPVFFIGAQSVANYTSVREKQQSSFAFDPHNKLTAGIAAGLQWNFNWGKYESNIKKAQAEYEKISARKKQADSGYPLEISVAFWSMQKNKNIWQIAHKKEKEAKSWSVAEYTTHSSGLSSSKDLVESLATYHLTKKEVIEAEYSYLISWATLSLKVGESSMLKDW